MTTNDVFNFARIAARIADEKIGEDIVIYDVRRESNIADCFMLVTGTTHLHIRALEDGIREGLRHAGLNLIRTDGQRGHLWRALDYGSLIIHIMDQKTREFYSMEKLWERGKKLPLTPSKSKVISKVKPKKSPKKKTVSRKKKKK